MTQTDNSNSQQARSHQNQASILIVDDTPQNLRLLADLLGQAGYKVRPAPSGAHALRAATKNPPDLILLDIMMPQMDGYQVCQYLKADETTRDIPVLFISALDQTDDKLKGFEYGAVDYISKPFQAREVLARVETHLNLRAARLQLEEQNSDLVEAAQLREDVDHVLRHDLKTPLSQIIGFSDIVGLQGTLNKDQHKSTEMIISCAYRMLNMINASLDLMKMERGTYDYHPVPLDLFKVIRAVITENRILADRGEIDFSVIINDSPVSLGQDNKDSLFPVQGEEFLCHSMLSGLIKNAIEASARKEQIILKCSTTEDHRARILIRNKGEVPQAIRERFFDKYVTAGKHGGTGLGTYSAALMVRTQAGTIELDSSESGYTSIAISLPLPDLTFMEDYNRQRQSTKKRKEDVLKLPPWRVLIADDDEANHIFLTHKLPSPPLSISSVIDGLAAVEAVKKSSYDIILMDWHMPVMDGLEAITAIRQHEASLQSEGSRAVIIALSAQDTEAIRKKSLTVGCDYFLPKWASRSQLVDLFRQLSGLDDLTKEKPVQPPFARQGKDAGLNSANHIIVDQDLQDVLPSVMDSWKDQLIGLSHLLESEDDVDLKHLHSLAHRLKGSFNMYGFQRAGILAYELEKSTGTRPFSHHESGKIVFSLLEHLEQITLEYKVLEEEEFIM